MNTDNYCNSVNTEPNIVAQTSPKANSACWCPVLGLLGGGCFLIGGHIYFACYAFFATVGMF